jgi:hypothetical protein
MSQRQVARLTRLRDELLVQAGLVSQGCGLLTTSSELTHHDPRTVECGTEAARVMPPGDQGLAPPYCSL